MCFCVSASIPQPVSETDSITCFPECIDSYRLANSSSISTLDVSIVIFPPWGIASRALTTRFISTCSICPGSALIFPISGLSSVTNSMLSGISLPSIFPISVTRKLRSKTFGCSICLRLKASSCRVKTAARSPAFLISWMGRRNGSAALKRPSVISL